MEVTEHLKNRLTATFKEKRNLLSIYFTAGYPELNDTTRVLEALQTAGVDMVEIGMPFSDPMADGPVIQASSDKALKNGMSLKLLFEQLKDIRTTINIPILLMGYMNTVLHFGIENFCKKAAEVGVDGVILPDMPLEEFNEKHRAVFEAYNLSFIFLVTPQTSDERLKEIDASATGFVYIVSTASTTGNQKTIMDAGDYLEKISKAGLKCPTMIGFNVKDKKSFEFSCKYANGAIIGSAFISALSETENLEGTIHNFVSSIK